MANEHLCMLFLLCMNLNALYTVIVCSNTSSFIDLLRSAFVHPRNITFSILLCVKLPLMPVSLLYYSIAAFWLVLVQNVVILTDLTMAKLKTLVLTVFISLYLWSISALACLVDCSASFSCCFFWCCCGGASTYSFKMVGMHIPCTLLLKCQASLYLCELFLLAPFWLVHLTMSNSLFYL